MTEEERKQKSDNALIRTIGEKQSVEMGFFIMTVLSDEEFRKIRLQALNDEESEEDYLGKTATHILREVL
jgi:hypothetical protein